MLRKSVLILAILLVANQLTARDTVQKPAKQGKSKGFKIDMDFPKSFKYYTEKKGPWGLLEGEEKSSQTYMLAYAYKKKGKGKVKKDDIYDFGVKETGIGYKYWEKIAKGKNKKGFAWFEVFEASDKKNSVYAIVAKNKWHNIYYLIFIGAPTKSFSKYEEDYMAWYKSVRGLK